MDIIFLSHRIPYPPDKGDKIRSHAMFTHLAKSHRVHLACFVDDPADFAHVETVREIAGGDCLFLPLKPSAKYLSIPRALISGEPVTTAYFGNPEIHQWIERVAKAHAIGATVVFSSAMARYVLDRSPKEASRAVLDLVDIDSDKWRQYAVQSYGLKRWIFQREATALQRLERRAARRFGATVLVSNYEAQSFAALAPECALRIGALENGVDSRYFAPGPFPSPYPDGETPIAMTGRMDYEPNVDAAKWFLTEIMPRVRTAIPNARFHAVGAHPARSLRALAGPGLALTGYVKDVRPYLQHAAAIVAPLRIARGVQNKVLEAMAMARPIVATTAATRALDVVGGVHLSIADSPDAFADAVIDAVRGSDRDRISARGREFVLDRHDWSRALAGLDALIDQVSRHTVPRAAAGLPSKPAPLPREMPIERSLR